MVIKKLFLTIFDLCSSNVLNVFDCRLSGVLKANSNVQHCSAAICPLFDLNKLHHFLG